MCGRYVLKREDLEALVQQFGLRSLEEFHSRYNIAPTSIVPLIRQTRRPDDSTRAAPEETTDAETDAAAAGSPANPPAPSGPASSSVELAPVRWGLIPAWTKPDAPARPLVNVRAETLVTRFRGALRYRRCVLPASGFYEWATIGTRKQPWYFAARDGGPLGLAGIWDTWHGDAATTLETCAIITTSPNGILRSIHDRMPVLLTPDQCRAWLDPRKRDVADLQPLLASAPDDAITATKVGPAVSSVRNDGPECIAAAPAGRDPEPQLSLF